MPRPSLAPVEAASMEGSPHIFSQSWHVILRPQAILPIPTALPAPPDQPCPSPSASFLSKALLIVQVPAIGKGWGSYLVQEPRGVTGIGRVKEEQGAWELFCAHLRKSPSDQGRSLIAQQSLVVSHRASWGLAQPPQQLAGVSGPNGRTGEEGGPEGRVGEEAKDNKLAPGLEPGAGWC